MFCPAVISNPSELFMTHQELWEMVFRAHDT